MNEASKGEIMKRKMNVISMLFAITMVANCCCMEYVENTVGKVTDLVKGAYTTARGKVNPTKIFKEIDSEWQRSSEREQITLLQKLNRGFLDGLIPEGDLPKLLDEVEATIPKYPVASVTLDQIYTHLESKLPSINNKRALLFRAITAMYLLKPRSLATKITNNTFVNNVTDETERENIIGTTLQHLIRSEDSKGINALVSAVQNNQQVTFGATAKKDATNFLGILMGTTLQSVTFLRGLQALAIHENGNGHSTLANSNSSSNSAPNGNDDTKDQNGNGSGSGNPPATGGSTNTNPNDSKIDNSTPTNAVSVDGSGDTNPPATGDNKTTNSENDINNSNND